MQSRSGDIRGSLARFLHQMVVCAEARFKVHHPGSKDANPESDWYTWDVVASAAGLPFKVELEPLPWFFSYRDGINRAFAPENWDETRRRLAIVEEEKRRRFTEGQSVSARDPVRA